MLSQQEHEDEEARKRNDDAKLQIALEQSKSEGQPNGLLDLDDFGAAFTPSSKTQNNDPWAGNNNNNSSNNKKFNTYEDTDSDDFFPPLSSLKPAEQNFNGKSNILLDDPWSTTAPASTPAASASTLDPWNNTPTNTKNNTNNSNQTNPWQPTSDSLGKDPWSTTTTVTNNKKVDDFDVFTTNRVNTPNSPTPPTQPAQKQMSLDPFGDFFESSATATSTNHQDPASTNPWNSDENSAQKTKDNQAIRKTPESFLGENSSLVNLENLIPSSRPKSTNPFGAGTHGNTPGMSSSMSSGQLNNPFLAQQVLQSSGKPSINQLQQQQQKQQQPTLYPSLFNTNINNNNNNSTFMNTGQLAQPLIIPPRPALSSGGVLMPMLNPQSINANDSMFLSSNSTPNNTNSNVNNSTNPFLAM
jgi:epsin